MLSTTYGAKLKALREASGCSVSDLARKTRLTRQRIYQIERSAGAPRLETLLAILTVLGPTSQERKEIIELVIVEEEKNAHVREYLELKSLVGSTDKNLVDRLAEEFVVLRGMDDLDFIKQRLRQIVRGS